MSSKLIYKGYCGSIEASVEDDCLFGRIQDINDIITYEGNTVSELTAAFNVAVEEYLQFCSENNREADKPYSGSFNVRVNKELHKRAAGVAREQNISLNSLVGEALQSYLDGSVDSELRNTKRNQNFGYIVSVASSEPSFFEGVSTPEDCYLLVGSSTPEMWEASYERKH